MQLWAYIVLLNLHFLFYSFLPLRHYPFNVALCLHFFVINMITLSITCPYLREDIQKQIQK